MNAFSNPRAAYIHVPFCAHRCGYCDFTLIAGRDDLIDDYLCALELELKRRESPQIVETLFFGGGTPTQLSGAQLERLIQIVFTWLVPTSDCEITVEANPTGLDDTKMKALANAGVNRVSLGVQSFDDSLLKRLGRDHTQADIYTTLERLRWRFENIALDLIFGVPGQTLEVWRDTLATAVHLAPQHLSVYGLTYEKGTAFWSQKRKGQLVPVPEEQERAMYAAAMDDLAAAGFEQYELSNFCRAGFQCRHNEVYWHGLPFFGFGPGAARYVDGRRETNHRSVGTWLKRTLSGQSAIAESECLSAEDRARELIVLALRRTQGIDRREFHDHTGLELDELAPDAIRHHCKSGLLEDTGTHIRLSREGHFLADSVIIDFL